MICPSRQITTELRVLITPFRRCRWPAGSQLALLPEVWRFGWGRYHSWGGPAAGLDLHAGLAWLPPEAVADELQGALLPRG